ncbi:hypothetical protein E2986_12083 [Frieseomelitta varia]|uniref:Uncharacterized protein n=1 Tax=Frieseomelitta varia TaxID=561572 RepID=A0A833S0K4_9HYME|nr:hypothetical protein E2986_12083 [Frieseomelitta varia]
MYSLKNELAESTRGQKSTISSGNAKNPIKQNHCRQGTTKTHKAQKLRLLTITEIFKVKQLRNVSGYPDHLCIYSAI